MKRIVPALICALLAACSSDSSSAPNNAASTVGASCSTDADCAVPAACSGGICAAPPSCSAPSVGQLKSGGTAGPSQAPASCVKTVEGSSVQAKKLGTHTVGDVLQFDVPRGTGSFTILSQAVSATDSITYSGSNLGNTVVPTLIKDPSGTVLYDDTVQSDADPSKATVFYGSESPVAGAFTIPNTTTLLHGVQSGGGLASGTWHFTVNDWAYECLTLNGCTGGSNKSQYDVQVVLRAASIPSSGTVNLGIYLVGGSLTAASAVNDAAIARMLKTMSQFYSNAGLCLGTVTFYDVPDWAKTKYGSGLNVDDQSPCGDLSQMFTLSQPGNQLNLFLVDDMVAAQQGNAVVVGVDGSIPGPSTIGGTVNSGAAVSSADLSTTGCGSNVDVIHCGADEVAYIAAHEGGHWMGLYHPTEQNGDLFDPLSDTATCSCTSCAPSSQQSSCTQNNPNASSPTLMEGSWCTTSSCGGGENLMFWVISSTSRGTLTSDQGGVVRANPVVH